MMRIALVSLFLTFLATICLKAQGPGCSDTYIYSDVLFLVDNSGSITDAEYNSFQQIMQETVSKVQGNCPTANIAVVHYGGNRGDSTIVEYDFTNSSITTINRQFCISNPFGTCVSGDDLNTVIGDVLTYFTNGGLSLTSGNRLSVVIMTDAFGGELGPCDLDNCSAIRPYTNIEILKANYQANVLVVGVEPDADAAELAPYASIGEAYTGFLNGDCIGTAEGCAVPRQYIPIQFADDIQMASDSISKSVQCQVITIPAVTVSAGADTTICDDGSSLAFLTATPFGGTAPFLYNWDNGLGIGPSKNVSPLTTTTYTVTITDANDCQSVDQVTVSVASCGPDCSDDFIYSDILFMIDNSGSITDAEYASFEAIMVSTINKVQASCPSANIAVVHYGGDLGDSTIVEYDFTNTASISSINRQFCISNPFGTCVSGDDLNAAMGNVINYFQNGSLNRTPQNQLSVVVFTDAFGGELGPCDLVNCSAIRPYTNAGILKTTYSAKVLVIGVEPDADAAELAPVASIGGWYNGSLNSDCSGAVDGCTTPRLYIPIQFADDVEMASDSIAKAVECTVIILPKVVAEAGDDVTICSNVNQSATLSASATVGVAPYTYEWSGTLGFGSNKNVKPPSTTTFYVTVTDANTCTAVDSVTVTVKTCDICFADAGTPLPHKELCLINNKAFLYTDENVGLTKPPGFEEVYILTDENLTILNYRIGKGSFSVSKKGLYRIHTLVAEVNNFASKDFLNLNIIKKGVSNLFVIVNCIEQHGVCADFDFPGRVHIVLGPEDMMCMTFENSINLCSDGLDNDSDGLVDCADNDCHDLINCLENTLIACNDLFDNDGDGLVDCYDPDCFQFVKCFERDEQCGDGIDNDGDGLVDCADNSCAGSYLCEERTAFTCLDGKDNDSDGLIDCEESSCRKFLICAEYSVDACSDGIDNDFDGLVDCADADCQKIYSQVCVWKEQSDVLCSDGKDNDGDGLIDCNDPDCGFFKLLSLQSTLPNYIEITDTNCPNNEDGVIGISLPLTGLKYIYSINGGESFQQNALFTNLVPGSYTVAVGISNDCFISTVVQITPDLCQEICNNGLDDDKDGLTDCSDPDCGLTELSPPIVSHATCPDNDNGSIVLFYGSSDGQTYGVEYKLNGGNYSTNGYFKDLSPGSYSITIRNQSGCTENVNISIQGEDILEINQIAVVDPSCPYQNNGSMMIVMQNSGLGYHYSINGGQSFQNSPVFNNLIPGEYKIEVVSDDGCLVESSATLSGIVCVEICGNDKDDDGNGLTDCQDPACGYSENGFYAFKSSSLLGKDATINNSVLNANTNFGSTQELLSQTWTDFANGSEENDSRFLIDFEIADLLASTPGELLNATIKLYNYEAYLFSNGGRFGNNAASVHIITQFWQEGSVTWNNQPTYLETPAVIIPRNNSYQSIEVNVSELLKKVRSESIPFYGFMIKQVNETPYSSMVFASREHNDSTKTPELIFEIATEFQLVQATCIIPGIVQFNKSSDDLKFSLDGTNYQSTPVFDNLDPGLYTGYIMNGNDCIKTVDFEITRPPCIEICQNGLDDDEDGLMDCDDPDCTSDDDITLANIQVTNSSCPGNDNGIINVNLAPESYLFGLSDTSFQSSPEFDSLIPGTYSVFIKNMNGCIEQLDISISGEVCLEICGNELDDDGNGLTDCFDPACSLDLATAGLELRVFGTSCPNNEDGSLEIFGLSQGHLYSLDGENFQDVELFRDLFPGSDTLFVQSPLGCIDMVIFEIEKETCFEICDNDIDDDQDGLVDCDDPDCILVNNCDSVGITSNLTVFLQGAYNPEEGKMSTSLNESGYLPGQLPTTFFGAPTPPGQPYNIAPWFYDGTESVKTSKGLRGEAQYHPEVVDWVLISLRQEAIKSTEVWRGAGLLYSDGYVELAKDISIANASKEGYYLVVEHRNHLPVMSKYKVPITDRTLVYDFTTTDSYYSLIGVGQVKTGDGHYAMIAGNGELIIELSSDIDVNVRDFNCWLYNNGLNSSYFLEDYDLNGDINIKDRIIWEKNNGMFSTITTK